VSVDSLAANALLFVGTGIILWTTHGHSNDIGMISLAALWLGAATARPRATTMSSEQAALAAGCWVALCGLMWTVGRPLLYAEPNAASMAIRCCSIAIIVFGLLAIVYRKRKPAATLIFTACWALALVVVALVLPASPKPKIDVFVNSTAAVDHLLDGRNPYSQIYEDIYKGRYDNPIAILYWPAILYVEGFARFTVHDIRGISVLGLFLSVLVGARVAKLAGVSDPLRAALVTAWIVFPVGPFVVEQAWNDPVLIAAFAVLAWALLTRNVAVFAFAIGAAFALKQYAIWGVVLAIVYASRTLGFKATALSVLGAAALFVATIVPFIIWDARELFYNTVWVPAHQSMRTDALSFLPILHGMIADPWPAIINGAAGLGALAVGVSWILRSPSPRLSDWTSGLVFTYGLFFLLSKQAFCNYYYLFAFFVWLHVTISIGRASSSLPPDSTIARHPG
jgi:hypothetical protein